MSDTVKATATVRDFVRQTYAETASAVQQVFTEDQINTTLQLAQVRICCGSDPVNRTATGYALPDGTPWLAELTFGRTAPQLSSAVPEDILLQGSRAIGRLPCQALQGIGPAWNNRLASDTIATIEALSLLDRDRLDAMACRWHSRQIVEFYARARVAMAPVPPVPHCSLFTRCPDDLLAWSPEEISQASGVLSVVSARPLLQYLSGLAAVLDGGFLAALTLREILAP